MDAIELKRASVLEAHEVSRLVTALLLELEPTAADDIEQLDIPSVTAQLLADGRIRAFIAYRRGAPVGVLTLHTCAAIYAGGLFGEISELYVEAEHRGAGIGQALLDAAIGFGRDQGWTRLEVGTPDVKHWARSRQFYMDHGFVETGPRLRCLL